MSLLSSTAGWVTEEHSLFADEASKFLDTELKPQIEKWANDGVVERNFWKKAGDMGLMGGSVHEEFGGSGGDIAALFAKEIFKEIIDINRKNSFYD